MALSVLIQPHPTPLLGEGEYEHVVDFDDDEGDYWFFYPLFQELAARTGQGIDLYGYAAFAGDDLDILDETIADARRLVERQPAEWEVVTAIELGRPPKEIRVNVSKVAMLSLLDALQAAIVTARERNHYVTFWGD